MPASRFSTTTSLPQSAADELAHLREPRRLVWARASRHFLIGVYAALVAASARPLPGSFGPLALMWGMLGATILLIVGLTLSNRLSLKMEHRADAQATESQVSPGVYARALEKLYQANLVPAVLRSKRMTHPHLYDRMIQAGVTPDYARPGASSAVGQLAGFGDPRLRAVARNLLLPARHKNAPGRSARAQGVDHVEIRWRRARFARTRRAS